MTTPADMPTHTTAPCTMASRLRKASCQYSAACVGLHVRVCICVCFCVLQSVSQQCSQTLGAVTALSIFLFFPTSSPFFFPPHLVLPCGCIVLLHFQELRAEQLYRLRSVGGCECAQAVVGGQEADWAGNVGRLHAWLWFIHSAQAHTFAH